MSMRFNIRAVVILVAGLAFVGIVAAVVALAAASSTALVVTAATTLLASVVVAAGLRVSRDRLVITERRLRVAQAQLDDLRAQRITPSGGGTGAQLVTAADQDFVERTELALTLLHARIGQGRPEPYSGTHDAMALFPYATVVNTVLRLIDDDDILAAEQLVRAHDVAAELPLRTLRLHARGLRNRGYLCKAMDYFERAAAMGNANDQKTLLLRRSELEVMSGAFTLDLSEHDDGIVMEPDARCVLHVVGRSIPETQSGYTLRTQHTASAQVRTGLVPHVFAHTAKAVIAERAVEVIDDVVYHRPAIPSVFEVGHREWLKQSAEALYSLVREIKPKVMHAHSDFFNAYLAEAVSKVTGIPVVYETRGFWEESWLSRTADRYGWRDLEALFATHGVPEAYAWRRDREEVARANADHVVTLAAVMATRITDAGLPPARLSLVPNAVDADRFANPPYDAGLAMKHAIPQGALVIGCVTSVVEYEGLEVLLDAFTDLTTGSSTRPWLLVVGDGPARHALEEQAERLGLDNVTFTGRVPHSEVLRYYGLIDIFVVPRRPVTVCHLVTPLKPFEAFAAGRPVVLSDVGALREIAGDSGAAALFRAGSPSDLRAVLNDLLSSPQRRATLAQRGARWVSSERTWDKNAERYQNVYSTVLAGVER